MSQALRSFDQSSQNSKGDTSGGFLVSFVLANQWANFMFSISVPWHSRRKFKRCDFFWYKFGPFWHKFFDGPKYVLLTQIIKIDINSIYLDKNSSRTYRINVKTSRINVNTSRMDLKTSRVDLKTSRINVKTSRMGLKTRFSRIPSKRRFSGIPFSTFLHWFYTFENYFCQDISN